jgi:hypothetical protein
MKVDIQESSASGHPVYGFLYHAMSLAFPIGIIAMMVFGIINAK